MTVLVFESAIDELRNLNGIGARTYFVTEAGIHQHHGSLGEQTQVRGSCFARGDIQRERHIDGYAIKARPLNRLGQFEHGHTRRMDRITLGMRNGKTGDKPVSASFSRAIKAASTADASSAKPSSIACSDK